MDPVFLSIPLSELIEKAGECLENEGYHPDTIKKFRRVWKKLLIIFNEKGELYLDEDKAFNCLKNDFDIDPFTKSMDRTRGERTTFSAIMALLEYRSFGYIFRAKNYEKLTIPHSYETVVNQFLDYLSDTQYYRPTTIKVRRQNLLDFLNFLDSRNVRDIKQVKNKDIYDYIETLEHYNRTYVSRVVVALREFFEFALMRRYTTRRYSFPRIVVYSNHKIREYYTEEEIKKIINVIDASNPEGKRDLAIILCGARYGLRGSDVQNLRLKNIDFVNNKIQLNQIKTGNPVTFDLMKDVGWAIIDYLKNGRPKECKNDYLFVYHKPPYNPVDKVSKILEQYALIAGVDKTNNNSPGFHLLRYSLASELLKKDVSLDTISNILGHTDHRTALGYIQLDFDKLADCALEVPNDL